MSIEPLMWWTCCCCCYCCLRIFQICLSKTTLHVLHVVACVNGLPFFEWFLRALKAEGRLIQILCIWRRGVWFFLLMWAVCRKNLTFLITDGYIGQHVGPDFLVFYVVQSYSCRDILIRSVCTIEHMAFGKTNQPWYLHIYWSIGTESTEYWILNEWIDLHYLEK